MNKVFNTLVADARQLDQEKRFLSLVAARELRRTAPYIYGELRGMYHKPSAIGNFLLEPQHHLQGERPAEYLARGDATRVRQLIDYLNSGVYS